jgi:hypothetical protein
MEKIGRRSFCGTALLTFPLLSLCAKDNDRASGSDQPDPLIDILAGEFVRTTADGAQNGFRAEHYRQYASQVRILDAGLESRGMNGEINKRLDDEDDYYRLNPEFAAKNTATFWRKQGVLLNESDLAARLAVDREAYREAKKTIKQRGGVRALHASVAAVFERKAHEQGTAALRGGPVFQNGRILFPPASDTSRSSKFMAVQFDPQAALDSMYPNIVRGPNWDCLCRAMIVEGSLLALACLAFILPLCEAGAFLLALEKLMEGLGICDAKRC